MKKQNLHPTKTAAIRKDFLRKCHYIFGRHVKPGDSFSALDIKGDITTGSFTALYYEPTASTLLVSDDNHQDFFFLTGDMAQSKKILYCEDKSGRIHLNQPLEQIVTEYMAQMDLTFSEDTIFNALRQKYYRMPPTFIRIIAKWFAGTTYSSQKLIRLKPRCFSIGFTFPDVPYRKCR